MTLRDLVARFFAPRHRRALLARGEHWEFYYDDAKPVLEFRPAADGLVIGVELDEAEHKRWLKEGPPFLQERYQQALREPAPAPALRFDPEVAAQLEAGFPSVIRDRAAHHLAQYHAEQPQQRRVQLALLQLAHGDLHQLKRHVRNALVDYRDVLREAGSVDDGEMLPEGATGIDLSDGLIITADFEIMPETAPFELIEAGLADDVVDDTEPLAVPLTRPVELAGALFHIVLLYEHDVIAEAHLASADGGDAADWLSKNVGGTAKAFSWGKIDLLQEGAAPPSIVVRYHS